MSAPRYIFLHDLDHNTITVFFHLLTYYYFLFYQQCLVKLNNSKNYFEFPGYFSKIYDVSLEETRTV